MPEAGAEVAHGLRDPGRLPVARRRRAVDRVGVGRAQHQAHADPHHHDPVPLVVDVEVGQGPGPEVEAHGGDGRSRDDRGLRPALVEDAPADLGRGREPGEEDQQVQPRLGGPVAEPDLGVHAGEEERDEADHHEEQDRVLRREAAVLEDSDPDQGIVGAELEADEGRQQQRGRPRSSRWSRPLPSPTCSPAAGPARRAPCRRDRSGRRDSRSGPAACSARAWRGRSGSGR